MAWQLGVQSQISQVGQIEDTLVRETLFVRKKTIKYN